MESRIDRRRFIGVAGAGVAGAGIAGATTRASARAAIAPPPKGPPVPDGPNVLVIVIDSLRYDHVGANGNRWIRTPNIDALARESLRFHRAFPEAMPTVPARRSLMTGRRIYPWTNWHPTRNLPGTPGWTGLAAEEQTWLKVLRAAGFWTGYVTDNPFLGFDPSWAPLRRGVDRFMRIGGQVGARRPASSISLATAEHWLPVNMETDHYIRGMRQHLANLAGARDEREQCAARVFSHAVDMLATAKRARRPFALVVDCFDPHEPWAPVQKYRDLYLDKTYTGNEPGNVRYQPSRYLTPDELKRLPGLYAAAVTQTDAWLGHFLSKFYDSGVADDTAIVLLSDHGIVLGERGWTGKPALELHPELTHVPMLIRSPDRRRAGQTTDYFASPHDVGPTLLSITGVKRPTTMDGSDMSPLLSGSAPAMKRTFWYGGYANHWYYRDDRWALIADGNNSGRELFDHRKDPGERRNIARDHLPLLDQIYKRVLKSANLTRLPYFGKR
ncbi:sulfatase [Conexibacter sp. CPCC 206217]|uniref:sulfatase family protein n=1 Tax=Conexibacter sp. CPCC 206217 TaxID=3064574 RepID=UPI0027284C8B|nr:sulfatase-like hydrolase/transferase [Conexibacter sp. CPCC 206217]MDO8214109.1 sulfatase-like hydrolase/transferase [Conexibacter sp. CPCC 206217]